MTVGNLAMVVRSSRAKEGLRLIGVIKRAEICGEGVGMLAW